MTPNSFYVTTPIYYVNAEPHLGHAYSTMAADILARHHRQRGDDVFFLTGTDEHGEPVENAAKKAGVTPQELADTNAAKFEGLMPTIGATNDFFIRTSDPRHEAQVAEIIQRVYDNGWVTKGSYEGWYCPRCADFKTERELGPGNTCPIHEIPLEREKEENWFFKLSAFQSQLEGLYEERPDFVVPDFRRNEALSFIKSGLEDVSLSRPNLKWGLRLPWDPEQRMYVWFDALLNYVTALTFAREEEDLTDRYWPADLHMMAKDILKFHAVIWPALLWAADLEPPKRMVIHGFLLMGEKKMSKSLGNVLDPFEVIDRFGADALRFYLFREVSFGQDGSISTAGFEQRYETELANDYGNLASRVLAMVDRYRDGTVPVAQVDATLAEDFEGAVARFSDLLDRAELSQALDVVWTLVRRLNRYVEETQPWVLAKDEADPERLDEVLYNLVEGLRVTTLLLVPYLPQTSETLLAALGEEGRALAELGSRAGGQSIERTPPLFPKIDPAGLMAAPVLAVQELSKRYGKQEALAGVDLQVEAGQLVGLLGPNGAGKSTLTKIACGLVRPSGGGVEVAGHPAGSPEARAALGYLAELFRFPGWATADELLRFHQRLVGSAGGEAERRELLDLVDLSAAAGKRVEAMSKGMQQRLGVAQALIGSPRLLLLDEPTSALDPVGRRIVRELLEELRRREVAVLLNSHLLSEVELVCDHVAIIAGGRLVKAGTPTELAGPAAVEVETGSGVRTFEGATREDAPRIVAELVAAGERVYRVEVRHSSLEDVYLDAVGGQTG